MRLAAGSLTRRFEGEPNEFLRIQILGTLALLEPNNPRWPAKLYELAASPDKALAEAAERALIHAGK